MEMADYYDEPNAEGGQPELLALIGLLALGEALLAEGRSTFLLGIIGLASLAGSLASYAELKRPLPFEGCSQERGSLKVGEAPMPALSHSCSSPSPEYSWVAAVKASRQESRHR